jgi:hypothetical protein
MEERRGDETRTRLIADMHSFVYGSVAEDYWIEDKYLKIPVGLWVG